MIQNAVSAKLTELTTEQLRDLVVKGMQEKKAQDIVVMDLRNVKNAITDYFVICSGSSDTQIDAIAGSIEEEILKVSRVFPTNREGKLNREWILLDYMDVVVHVFKKDRRAFYDLEQLWGDAEMTWVDNESDVFVQR
ncbi:ribosome silencing factor [Fibrella forsythiae]|uniref:Ribosomal silencing factor RsfS n=1 Tax=Fibrella forsythiae TaxID=2817061 RepID=A0ABS3JGG3_9BACT|nr:ribosome silencing factor [Fibrella forsythiae]MBO0949083.1 ribosome silencing factor [Fibrella forsythiae]RYF72330.1 MAG: ribosome silencing factor [Cytophagaceae bacterium]